MKYKVGDKVKIKENLKEGMYGSLYFDKSMEKFCGKYATISEVRDLYERYRLDIDDEEWSWSEDLFDEPKFEKGDIVKINKNATINDFTRDHWNGCQISTLDFIQQYTDSDLEFVVDAVPCSEHCVKISGLLVNVNILTLVKKKEEAKKKMTIAEIEKELGYEIKIVKENENE